MYRSFLYPLDHSLRHPMLLGQNPKENVSSAGGAYRSLRIACQRLSASQSLTSSLRPVSLSLWQRPYRPKDIDNT